MIKINVCSENINENISINEKKYITVAKKIFKFYMAQDFFKNSAVNSFDYKCITFDILYCDSLFSE